MSNIDFSQVITAEAREAWKLQAAKDGARAGVLQALDAAALAMTGEVPEAEKLSWTAKEAAARAIEAGTADATQVAMLAAEAAQTGEEQADLVARIVANADAYRLAAAAMAGIRRKAMAGIDAAASPSEVEAARDAALATVAGLG